MRIEQFITGVALDDLLDVLLLVGPDGRVLDANSAALECYGYTHAEILALGRADLTDGQVRVGPAFDPQEVRAQTLCEERHLRRDGTAFPVETRSVRVSAGGEDAMLVTVRDITDRKCAEDRLRESEAKHSSMISNISDVIGIIGTDGLMKYKSPNIEKWFGWQPEDLIGTDGWRTVHPDDLARIQREFYELLQQDGGSKTVEYRYLCKDGSYKWIGLTARNLVNDPIISGVLMNYHDITARKEVERLGRELTSIIDVIGTVSEMRDPYTAGHQRRVSELAFVMATDLGMSSTDAEDIRVAGLMHDIGKMTVPVEILSMPRQLSPAELSLVRGHAEAGYSIITAANMPGPMAELVYQHHERCDGSGYPRGLSAAELLEGSKVLMVADVVEAMMSHRPYRPALGQEAALHEIEQGAGSIFDRDVADACVRVFRERSFAFAGS